MNNILGLAILAVATSCLIFGVNEIALLQLPTFPVFFSGNPTDHSMWLILGGAGLRVVVGSGPWAVRGAATRALTGKRGTRQRTRKTRFNQPPKTFDSVRSGLNLGCRVP
jgi:hypothetical protein